MSAADIAVPSGYRIEPVATGLTFPTGVAFDDKGGVYVTVRQPWTSSQVAAKPRKGTGVLWRVTRKSSSR